MICLLGYMGSGKSAVAQELGGLLDVSYADLDGLMEEKESLKISEIFSDKGVIYFRKLENEVLLDVISNKNIPVLSLGGGTPCYYNHMSTLNNAAGVTTIYLHATIPTLTKRLWSEREQRPLISEIKTPSDLSEFIGKHLFERSEVYRQAHHIVTTDSKDVEEIALEIQQLLA